MIVFFEDGPIANKTLVIDGQEILIKVDAGDGFTNCLNKFIAITNKLPFNTMVYTNSLDAFSNSWCWDDVKKIPMIYIRDKTHEWKLISDCTTRKLRRAQNLEKMYVNGIFCDIDIFREVL